MHECRFQRGDVLVAVLLRMAVADSTAVFKARALACGLAGDDYDKFKSAGLDTMALFAFSCNYAPGASDEKPLTDLIAKLLGGVPTVKQLASARRLFAESDSAIASDIKSQVESTDETSAQGTTAAHYCGGPSWRSQNCLCFAALKAGPPDFPITWASSWQCCWPAS